MATIDSSSTPLQYCVYMAVAEAIAHEWKTWMLTRHIPDVLSTQLFQGASLQQEIQDDETKKEEYLTFHIIYTPLHQAALQEYQTKHAPALMAMHTEKYAGKCTAVRKITRIIAEITPEK